MASLPAFAIRFVMAVFLILGVGCTTQEPALPAAPLTSGESALDAGFNKLPEAPVAPSPAQGETKAPSALPASMPAAPEPEPPVLYPGKVYIPVLNYHSVSVEPGNIAVITPEKFEQHMEYLHKEGFTPITLKDFMLMFEGRKALPKKPVLLTFDDGYIDNLTAANPVLRKYNYPATIFISPGFKGTRNFMSWEQVKELHNTGHWDVQSHGMTHPRLWQLSREQQDYEIGESKRLIEQELGKKVEVFCYPYGEYNKTTVELVKKHGYKYAFTIRQGTTDNEQDPFLLARLFVNGEEPLGELIYWLSRIHPPE